MTPKEIKEVKKIVEDLITKEISSLMKDTEEEDDFRERKKGQTKSLPDLIDEKNSQLKKEIIDEIVEKIQEQVRDPGDPDPYKTLQKFSIEALTQVKKDRVSALERHENYGDTPEMREATKREEQINKKLHDIIKIVREEKEAEEDRIEFDNPLYPTKKAFRFIPAFLRPSKYTRGARNWLGLLFTGIGLTVMARGIWDASEWLLSVQGSIIVGGIIVALTAWLERRKVFALFGQE